jgi:hypothetical protein
VANCVKTQKDENSKDGKMEIDFSMGLFGERDRGA